MGKSEENLNDLVEKLTDLENKLGTKMSQEDVETAIKDFSIALTTLKQLQKDILSDSALNSAKKIETLDEDSPFET
ncbi:MAG: hypothetical protein IPK14_19835 [Blastocatellia bacterium]|nr:hypothetical protein [Blastocatellia bacterium]MBL8194363.1 hypothetical protein [Blastocatellia bacterium]MBN8722310.1 hypothetical protein [Acidobacteriota bacterium]